MYESLDQTAKKANRKTSPQHSSTGGVLGMIEVGRDSHGTDRQDYAEQTEDTTPQSLLEGFILQGYRSPFSD